MMEGSHKKKPKKPNLLADTVFSWSIDDVFNERLFKKKVGKILNHFTLWSITSAVICILYWKKHEHRSIQVWKLFTEHHLLKVISFEKVKPHGTQLYDIKVDYWRNKFNDRGKEPYETLPGDPFILANAKPETFSDLQRIGRSWDFASVTKISGNESRDESTSLTFKIKGFKELEVVKGSTSLYMVFLVNLIRNGRIWNALHVQKPEDYSGSFAL